MNRSNILLLFMLIGSMAIQANSNVEAWFDAVEDNDIAKVKQLLQAGADVNAKDVQGVTVLMYAAHKKGNQDMIKLLLEAGADVNAIGTYDDYYFDLTPLKSAILAENLPAVRLLLDSGADANAHGDYGRTPLMAAVQRDFVEAVKLLIEKGASVNAKDANGATALSQAKDRLDGVIDPEWASKIKQIISLLEKEGAK